MSRNWISITVLILVITGIFAYRFRKVSAPVAPIIEPTPTVDLYSRRRNAPCPGPDRTNVMPDVYLRGVLEKAQSFRWIENYYNCNPIAHGDLAVFQYHTNLPPVVRKVVGIPGDEFTTVMDPQQGWTIVINGKTVGTQGQPYFFGVPSAPPPLALAEKSHQRKLGPREVILLSSFPPGELDSGTMGIISLDDVVGKVIRPETPKQ